MAFEEVDPRIFDCDSYWKPYKFVEGNPKQWKKILLSLNGSTWPVKSYLKSSVRVRGVLHIIEVSENVILLAPEVISKSINNRRIFRIIIIEGYALVQDETDGISKKFLIDYVAPLFKLSEAHFKELKMIN